MLIPSYFAAPKTKRLSGASDWRGSIGVTSVISAIVFMLDYGAQKDDMHVKIKKAQSTFHCDKPVDEICTLKIDKEPLFIRGNYLQVFFGDAAAAVNLHKVILRREEHPIRLVENFNAQTGEFNKKMLEIEICTSSAEAVLPLDVEPILSQMDEMKTDCFTKEVEYLPPENK